MKNWKRFSTSVCLVVFAALVWTGTGLAAEAAPPSPAAAAPKLSNDDCAKCHDKQPAEIAANGAAHKTQIGCQDCHTGHRPKSANNIPKCSMCHSGEKHFELEGCTSCHNPHQPLDVVLKGDLKKPCLTCHDAEGKTLEANPSKHTTFACNFCHANKHGVIPACVDCHEPHSDKMTQKDCNACHQAHKPLDVTYKPETPSIYCAACHDGVYKTLKASKAKHSTLECAFCHQLKHKMMPKCSDCHGLPHPETMHQKFPKCGECHNIAHDLNNWPSQKKEAPKAPAKPAPAKEGKKGSK